MRHPAPLAAPLVVVLTLLAAAAPSSAQDPMNARALFTAGVEALQADEPERARAHFEESLRLHAHPATAFNLAVALHELGRLRDAEQYLGALRAGRYGELDDEASTAARALLTEVRSGLATLDVQVRGVVDEARVEVDGEERGRVTADGAPLLIETDPGEHELRAVSEAGSSPPRTVRVEPGGGASVVLEIEAIPLPEAAPGLPLAEPEPDAAPGDDTVLHVILAVVIGALVVGGAVTAGVLLSQGAAPIEDDVFGVTVTLGGP